MLKSMARTLLAVGVLSACGLAHAEDKRPIKIGWGVTQSGALASGGKSAIVAARIWEEDINAKGGLLGRPVELVIYDDQSNPATVPGIYSKLIDIDKVDLLVSGYGTGVQAALIPLVMQRGKVLMGTMGTAANETFKYNRFFQILPAGPNSGTANSRGFFELATSMDPGPKTVALLGSDVEFSQSQQAGAREVAKSHGLKIVYDESFPPNTVDMTQIVRVMKASNPDIVWVATYPGESVALMRAVRDLGLAPKIMGGGMVGTQYAALKQQLGPLLNGLVNFNYYAPEPTMTFSGTDDFLKRYQARAVKEGTDELGYYIPSLIYAEFQVLAQAVMEANTLDDAKLAELLHKNTFETIVGAVKFGEYGEWEKSRILFTQFQNVAGNDLAQFKKAGTEVILYPPEFKSGKFVYPYSGIKKN
ncbi:branched-chain amino acid transport system substrate-binding protein [Nitrobacteraceae bacterium AZCC 2161]